MPSGKTEKDQPKPTSGATCDELMAAYLECVQGHSRGLSQVGGECEEEKKLYKECVKGERKSK